MMNPPILCRICGTPLEQAVQPALYRGGSEHLLVTCRNAACHMRGVTLTLADYPFVDTALYEAVTK